MSEKKLRANDMLKFSEMIRRSYMIRKEAQRESASTLGKNDVIIHDHIVDRHKTNDTVVYNITVNSKVNITADERCETIVRKDDQTVHRNSIVISPSLVIQPSISHALPQYEAPQTIENIQKDIPLPASSKNHTIQYASRFKTDRILNRMKDNPSQQNESSGREKWSLFRFIQSCCS